VNLPRRGQALSRALGAAIIIAGLGLTVRDYFGRYLGNPETKYFFQPAAADLAAQINAYLGGGWTGGLRLEAASHERHVYLDRRLWDSFASVRFLATEDARLSVFGPQEKLAPAATPEVRVIVWPYEDPRPALVVLPVGALIRAEAGPLYRNDTEPAPYSLFTTYTASPVPALPAPVAEFERGLILQSAAITPTVTGLQVDLIWAAPAAQWQPDDREYHVFVQLLDGPDLLTQNDGPPANGLYPTTWWRSGEVVLDPHLLEAPTRALSPSGWRVIVGLYEYASGERLRLRDGSGDFVALTIP